jgi:hypothetical protein
MSDKKVLLSFQFDTDTAVKNIQKAQKEIALIKDENKELQKEEKRRLDIQEKLISQGKASSKAYKNNEKELKSISEALINNNSQLRIQNKEVRENSKVLDQHTQFSKASEGSINEMRLALSDATARWNAMGAAERQTTEEGRNLQKHIKGLSDNLKELEGSVGDNRRNVGNYGDALKGLKGPVGQTVEGVKGFNMALKANPIMAILGLLMSLIGVIQKNEKVIKAIEAVTASFNAVLGVFTDRIIQAWEAIKSLDFSALINSFKGAGDAMANAANQAMILTKAQQMLKDATRESNEMAAKNEVQIQKLLQQSKDRTRSDEERIAALKKAQALEQEAFDAQFKNAQREFLVLQKLASLSTSTEAEKQKVSEAKIKFLSLEAESVKRQEKILREMNALEDEILGDKEKRAEKEAKIAEAANKRAADFRKNQEEINAKLKQEAADDVERLRKKEEEKERLLEQYREARRISGLSEDELRREQHEAEVQRLRDLGATEMEILRLQNEEKIRLLKEQEAAEIKEVEDAEKQKQELRRATLDATADLLGAMSNLLGAAAKENENIFEIMKGLDTATAIIKGLLAVQNTLATIPGPAGWAAATAIGIQTAANVVKIQSVQPPKSKFEFGGNIEGKSHSQGGVHIEAEGNEVIINKHSARKWWKTLDYINRDGGGNAIRRPKFALGGNIGATDGGYSNRGLSDNVDKALMVSEISKLKDVIGNIKVVAKISDINRVNDTSNFIRAKAEM